jgi:acetoacetyl-[acyl-carrier protein] synthase
MAVYAASDALNSVGIDYATIMQHLSPDQIAVFASNSIGQLDDYGFGGLTKFPALGKRTTSKQMPLGYAQMPADFINAYLLGNVGTTGGALGACATFLYNLKSGVDAIRSGRARWPKTSSWLHWTVSTPSATTTTAAPAARSVITAALPSANRASSWC